MKVLVCPSDKTGCGYYRVKSIVPWLPDDVEVDVSPGLALQYDPVAHKIKDEGTPDIDVDVLVIQRPTAWWQVQAIEVFKRRGVRIVVEIDDDFHALPPTNIAYKKLNPRYNAEYNWANLRKCVQLADLVTVSTDALAQRYGSHGRVVVLRNYVNPKWLTIETPQEHDLVGWSGTLATHWGDLRVTHGGVATAIEECNARFRVLGHPERVEVELGLHPPFQRDGDPTFCKDHLEHTPWCDIERYPYEIRKFGVGIAPLELSAFNAAKSWLKPLEYASVGVPCVMSPTPEYELLHERGVGILSPPRARNWRRAVRALLSDEAARQELSGTSRAAVRELTIDLHAWRWAEAWQAA